LQLIAAALFMLQLIQLDVKERRKNFSQCLNEFFFTGNWHIHTSQITILTKSGYLQFLILYSKKDVPYYLEILGSKSFAFNWKVISFCFTQAVSNACK